jgi:hypothetical protein
MEDKSFAGFLYVGCYAIVELRYSQIVDLHAQYRKAVLHCAYLVGNRRYIWIDWSVLDGHRLALASLMRENRGSELCSSALHPLVHFKCAIDTQR